MVILTDLSEVLIRGLYGTEDVLARKLTVSPIGREGLAAKIKLRFEEINDDFQELLRGHMHEDEYWQVFFSKGQWLFTMNDIKAAFAENMTSVIDGTLKVYQRIIRYPSNTTSRPDYQEGMPTIYVVSDHIHERINWLKSQHPGIFQVASDQYWSCDLGMIKQDEKFFPYLLDAAELNPDEALFIDDNPANVIAAARAGIKGIRFVNALQLETVMRETYGFVFEPPTP